MKDLVTVLELKPTFEQARIRLAELRVKEGSFSKAREDYKLMPTLAATPGQLKMIETGEQLSANAKSLSSAGDFAAAVDLLTQAIEISPNSAALRMRRAEGYQALGKTGEAIGDVMRVSKLTNGNVEANFLLSKLHFETGAREDALKEIRECVKLDGDHKGCYAFYKMLKKFNKVAAKVDQAFSRNQHAEALDQIKKLRAINEDTHFFQEWTATLECRILNSLQQRDKATIACDSALKLNPRNVEAMLVRAAMKEDAEDFEGAIADLKEALDWEENSQRIKDRIQKAERLLKQSKKRNYYKILGLPRNCKKKDITKAYRNLAMEWHPDKFTSEEEKKVAEAKFMDIAAAKEVLTDEKMRAKFDNGEDPLDAEEQSNKGGHGGFNPFGHGGHTFHFRH